MKIYDSIPPNLREWALKQKVFFTASAPLAGSHVNVSPKGLPSSTFHIFDAHHCAYIDATGSGNETISHIYENGRVTLMFCSFDRVPRIMRFFCRGRVVEAGGAGFAAALRRMGKERPEGARAVILLDVWKVQTSCGTGVPLLGAPQSAAEELANDASAGDGSAIPTGEAAPGEVLKDRASMTHWCERMVQSGKMDGYQRDNNALSMDGLKGMKSARRAQGERVFWVGDLMDAGRRVGRQREALVVGFVLGLLWVMVVNYLISLKAM